MQENQGFDLRKTLTRHLIEFSLMLGIACSGAAAQHWQAAPTFPGSGAGTAILTPVGDVLVQELTGPAQFGGFATGQWYVLHPDAHGSYATGFWGGPFSTPSGYAPLYFGSAVLPDGRVLVEGGEYNGAPPAVDTTRGALFDPSSGSFIDSIAHPSGWAKIGDAPTVILPNGKLMLGDCCSTKEAIFNASTLTWTSTGAGKADPNSEEGWTLLPNGKVLAVDTQNGNESELYDYTTGKWSLAGNTPQFLGNKCGMNIVPELGPAVLRPDGSVVAIGANTHTAIYSAKGVWSKGPNFPAGFGVADGPAALLPDGNVLVQVSSINPCFASPSRYYEITLDGNTLKSVVAPPNAPNEASFDGRMVVLPNGGHILHTDGTTDVEVYIPAGSAQSSWAPHITSHPASISEGGTYTLKGTQFNGLSQGAAYGDDAQSATNFPLVRINIGGFSYYLPTHNFSSGVATGAKTVSTEFDLPFFIGTGAATLQVVANGLASNAVSVTVK